MRERQQQHAHSEKMKMRDLEHSLITAWLHELLFRAEVILSDRRVREAHLLEIEQGIREPQGSNINNEKDNDELQETVLRPLASDDKTHDRIFAFLRLRKCDVVGLLLGRFGDLLVPLSDNDLKERQDFSYAIGNRPRAQRRADNTVNILAYL